MIHERKNTSSAAQLPSKEAIDVSNSLNFQSKLEFASNRLKGIGGSGKNIGGEKEFAGVKASESIESPRKYLANSQTK